MSNLQEITDLFARLALNLEIQERDEEEERACDLAVSKLNDSLNLHETSRVRVLDTVLSLLCFKAPQVFDSYIECLVETILTVLSSSISCNVLRFQNDEVLQVGSSISFQDGHELVRVCSDVIGRLNNNHGNLLCSLLHNVLRVVVLASCYRYSISSLPILDVKPIEERSCIVSKLKCHLPVGISLSEQVTPPSCYHGVTFCRLLLWYLDPVSLMNDISKILKAAMNRPFLSLNKEFHERMDWHSLLLCLVLSPAMFIETRALLHNWFLMTGLAYVQEFQTELVSLVLDVLSEPTCWGIPMEVGLKLLFSRAYFPHKDILLRTLTGPVSCENFLCLVHIVTESASHHSTSPNPNINQATTNTSLVDQRSDWALTMNFQDWLLFACGLLFSGKSSEDKLHLQCTFGATRTEQVYDVQRLCLTAATAAARYISWFLSPINEAFQHILYDCFTKLSASWKIGLDHWQKETTGYTKKLKKPKFHGKDHSVLQHFDCKDITLWLREFREISTKYWNEFGKSSEIGVATPSQANLEQNMLFRRIPLGIMIGSPNCLDEDGYELLLHFAATGMIKSRHAQSFKSRHIKQNSDVCSRSEAVAGARIVFGLTDAVERLSASMFGTEQDAEDFLCQMKIKAVNYLIKCTRVLLVCGDDVCGEDVVLTLADLHLKLVKWRMQGQENFQGHKDLDEVVDALGSFNKKGLVFEPGSSPRIFRDYSDGAGMLPYVVLQEECSSL
ncbi:hypothetical protein RJ641_025925 [Dillenia turbinata]|uniref:Uncharacterized protein n=1 Tax=Dillenia turbinata TaxID=194707 RepID=A0AAN8ZS50_9MAGN